MEFSVEKIEELFDFFADITTGISDFFHSFYEFISVLFPFFSDDHIQFLVTLCICFIALIVYLLFRKVTI